MTADLGKSGSLHSSRTCEHGATPDWWWKLLAGPSGGIGAWAGPITVCACCGADFGYIDSGSIGPNGSHGKSWTKGLCSRCGGHYVEY